MVEQFRIIKDEGEMERIRKSVKLTEQALESAWNTHGPRKKREGNSLADEKTIREGGGQAVSFPPIAAAGPNAALPPRGFRPIERSAAGSRSSSTWARSCPATVRT